MKRFLLFVAILGAITAAVVLELIGPPVGESAEGWFVGDQEYRVDFGYSYWGEHLRFAVVRTWPKKPSFEERLHDPRIARDSWGRLLVRAEDGKMIPVGSDGEVVLFDGAKLKRMRVKMNEHDDTVGLIGLNSLDEVWAYFGRFEVKNGM